MRVDLDVLFRDASYWLFFTFHHTTKGKNLHLSELECNSKLYGKHRICTEIWDNNHEDYHRLQWICWLTLRPTEI